MITPTQQILQRGSFANDGTGDTLRDAAQKINDNFTYVWAEVWDGEAVAPGREFICSSVTGGTPNEGTFTATRSTLDGDSNQDFRISRWDQNDKSFKTSNTSSGHATSVSVWNLDSGQLDDWNLVARYEGTVQYTNDYWVFTKTSTILATTDGVDSGGTYYLKLDGMW